MSFIRRGLEIKGPRANRGSSLVELAFVLPILVTLVLGVIDFGRALQFNNIVIAMSREGANLSARTTAAPSFIIGVLQTTGTPLQMTANGMIYLTRVVGNADGTATVSSQSRAVTGKAGILSRVYSCGAWSAGGNCALPTLGPIVNLTVPLIAGENVDIVEVAYDFDPIAGFVMTGTSHLYSQTML